MLCQWPILGVAMLREAYQARSRQSSAQPTLSCTFTSIRPVCHLTAAPTRNALAITDASHRSALHSTPDHFEQESNAPWVRSLAQREAGGRRGVVADVAKLAVGRQDYYTREIAQNHEEYLSGHGESPGRWYGRGAASLGQRGEANTEAFERIFEGRHPETGELLGRSHGRNAVPAFDVVFRPTKSVSILYALGDAATGRAVLAAHHAGLAEAVAYLDEHIGARRGHGGAEHVGGNGLLAVGFDHRTSREGDPLLHTHLVVANRVQGPDGRWTALDGRDLYRHRRAADAVYRAAYQRELTRSLGVEWTAADRHGNREVQGMPTELLRAFSKRAEQVNAEVERLEASGRERTPRLVKWAVHATRKAKEHEAPETLYDRWRAEAGERGIDADRLVRKVTGRARDRQAGVSDATAAVVFDQLASPDGLTAQASTFAREDVITALGAGLVGASRAELDGLADRFLAEQAVSVVADRALEERRWSTPELLGVEERLVAAAVDRAGERAGVASHEAVRAAPSRRRPPGDRQDVHLGRGAACLAARRLPAAGRRAHRDRDRELGGRGVRGRRHGRPAPARPRPPQGAAGRPQCAGGRRGRHGRLAQAHPPARARPPGSGEGGAGR